MPFIPVPKGILVTVNQLCNQERVQNTLWFESQDTITTTVCQDLAAAVRDLWIANMIPLQSNQVVLFSVEAVSRETQEGPYGIAVPAGPTPGLIIANTQANNVTCAISFRTGLTGRSNRGRNYWVGIPDTQITANLISAAYLTDVVSAYFTMVGADAVLPLTQWSVASLFTNNEPRVSGVLRNINAVEVVDNVADSMRRRLPGRGE